jgi:TrpR family trp operon transcriptional repressor
MHRIVSIDRNFAIMATNRLKEIASVLAGTDDLEQIEAFLKSILTKNEVDEISTRWELVKLLDGGMSQRKIADRLGVSLCKITRGSRELKKTHSPFRTMIEKHKEIAKQQPAKKQAK